jgi:hypothetical protein
MLPCNQVLYGWTLLIPLFEYLSLCFLIATVLRALQCLFRARAVQIGDFPHDEDRKVAIIPNFWRAFGLCFIGFNSYREHSDMWLPALIGVIELASYPVMLVLGQFVLIGGWLGIKTAGAWMGWKASRTSFNRFLLFNLLNLLIAFFWLSRYIKIADCAASVGIRLVEQAPALSFWQRLINLDSATVSAATSVVGAAFAIFIGLMVYRFNDNLRRNQASHNQIEMLLGIDGHLIEDPKLWWIWDDEDRPGPPQDKPSSVDDVGKRKAFLAAYFNMFEIVYDFYWNTLSWQTTKDAEKWQAWERYIRHFFVNSEDARTAFLRWRPLYSADFVSKMQEIIESQ